MSQPGTFTYPSRCRQTATAKDWKGYLAFAESVCATIGSPQEKADLLQRSAREFGLATSGQIKQLDGTILLVSHDRKKCFRISDFSFQLSAFPPLTPRP